MGYDTSFVGRLRLDHPLTPEHKAALDELADEEHVPGEDGKPAGRGCVYCQWRPTDGGTGIEWDLGEKFYCWVEWLQFIVDQRLKPWGYILNGEVRWRGESIDDAGIIYVKDNQIEAVADVNPGPSWGRR